MKFNGLDIDSIMFNGLPVTSVMLNGIDIHKAKIYGVSWEVSDNPIMTRTDDAVGMVADVGIDAQIVQNDFDSAEIYKDITEVTDSYGNVFVRIPKLYICKTVTGNQRTWQISKKPFTGAYLPWCFWDFGNSKELPYVDIGKYKASLSSDSTKLESKPGKYPLIYKSIVDFRNYARANGAGYQQLDVHAYDLLQVLFLVEFANIDCQAIMQGFTTGGYTDTHLATVSENGTNRIITANATADQYRVGQTISVSISLSDNQVFYGRTITAIEMYDADNKAIVFDGEPVNIAVGNYLSNTGWKNGFSANIAASSGSITANDSKYPCSYRGIESLYGDVFAWVDGVNINDRQAWVCKNAGEYTSNVFASPYEQLSYVNSSATGSPQAMGFDSNYPFAEFPTVTGLDRYMDYYYQDNGQRVARVGGNWFNGSRAGLFCWALHYSSRVTDIDIGGRLLKKAL